MCLAACRQGSARRKGQGGEGPARGEEGEDRASLVAPWVEEGGRAVPLAARALLPPTIKKIVIFGILWFFMVFSVFLPNITFALEDRFLWFLGVCISTFSHKNGYRKFQLLKLSRKKFRRE